MTSLLSAKTIDPRDRLIVALDLPDAAAARELVSELGDAVVFYKIGLELFMTGGYFELLNWLVSQGKKVFVDLKFFDVPETVRSAVRALAGSGATFATIHGNQAIMEAAVKDKGDLKILAVTVLTSLDRGDLDVQSKDDDDQQMGVKSMNQARMLAADIDWQPVLKQFSAVRSSDLIPSLAQYLWQTDARPPAAVLEKYTDHSSQERLIKTAMIRLMATPEYQLC